MPEDQVFTSGEASLDLREVLCPMTFVKTKLALETLPGGSVLTVRLGSEEALKNVRVSVEESGHRIREAAAEAGAYRLVIEKT